MKKAHKEEFLTHISSVDSNIQFTTEEPGPDGSLSFLDILITPDKDGRLDTTVYRKPTHMTNIFSGTVIIQSPQNIVLLEPSTTDLEPYIPTTNCCSNKKITYQEHWLTVTTPYGLWTE